MKWEDPPENLRRSGFSLAPLRKELKENPGKWALVQEQMKSSSSAKPWQKYGFEAVCRKDMGTGLYNIYARWPEAETEKVEVRSMLGSAVVEREKVPQVPAGRLHFTKDEKPPMPERRPGESDFAYGVRVDRWSRGVPSEGTLMPGEKPVRDRK